MNLGTVESGQLLCLRRVTRIVEFSCLCSERPLVGCGSVSRRMGSSLRPLLRNLFASFHNSNTMEIQNHCLAYLKPVNWEFRISDGSAETYWKQNQAGRDSAVQILTVFSPCLLICSFSVRLLHYTIGKEIHRVRYGNQADVWNNPVLFFSLQATARRITVQVHQCDERISVPMVHAKSRNGQTWIFWGTICFLDSFVNSLWIRRWPSLSLLRNMGRNP